MGLGEPEETSFGIGEAEERSLLRRIARGDEAARRRLLAAYEPLVASAARGYAPPGTPFYEDLCQQGHIGLLGALGAFKVEAGVRFGAYAKPWVQGAVTKGVAAAGSETPGFEADEYSTDRDDDAAWPDSDDLDGDEQGTPGHGQRPRHVTFLDDLVGGEESGRDAYLQHAAGEFADVATLFAAWLAQGGEEGEINPRVWVYLQKAERELLTRAREENQRQGALAQLEQKYNLACEYLLPDGRVRRASELVIGPDARSAALSQVLAHAVESGGLPERTWHTALAAQQRAPAYGPGFAEVRELRARLLPAGLLATGQIAAWIEAQAAREGGPAAAYLKVPLSAEEREGLGEPGGDERTAYAALLRTLARRLAKENEAELPAPDAALFLSYGTPGEELRLLRIRGDGELAALKGVAQSLTGHFSGWSEEAAVAFVLSGWVPPLEKLRAAPRRGLYRAVARITYDVDPRTSPAALAAFHARLRKRWVEGRDRLLGAKALALAVFAECSWEPGASWEELHRRWNEEHPEGDALHSELSTKQFATECRDAWERLTGEVWPGGSKANAKLKSDLAALRRRRKEAVQALPD